MVEDDLDAELAALRTAYGRDLPGKIVAVSEAIAARDHERTRALAHRLRGTAGVYGYAAVSAAAATIEEALLSGEPKSWEAIVDAGAKLVTAGAEAAAR